MVKILSQGGRSLADMYDVEGSIAGIEDLQTRELQIVHEMGATLFSERFRTTIRSVASAATAQNTDINLAITTLPNAITRILGIQVFADNGARIDRCQVSVNEPTNGDDFPIWVWDALNLSAGVRVEVDGGQVAVDILIPERNGSLPTFVTGAAGETRSQQAPDAVRDITVRSRTTGFGAGTVVLTVLVYVAFTYTGGVSAFGAIVPSW